MRQIGIVIASSGSKARVKVCRATACDQCGRCDEGRRALGHGAETAREIVVEALNEVDAKVGQTVELTSPHSAVLTAALWAYLLPFCAFVAGVVLGHWQGPSVGIGSQEASILAGLAGLLIAYGIIWLKDKSFRSDRRFVFVIDRIVG